VAAVSILSIKLTFNARQCEGEGAPNPHLACHADLAIQPLDDSLNNRQAQAVTIRPNVAQLCERREKLGLILWRQSLTVVLDPEPYHAVGQ
jgi:hypothetical protein